MSHDQRPSGERPGEPEPPEPMEIDASALRGLAHPLRERILDELGRNGPATATILGGRLGESSGSTSYHLRQLSRFGFVEDDPGHGGGRERWWRVRPGGWSMAGYDFLRDPRTRQMAQDVLVRYFRARAERFEAWNAYARARPSSAAVRRWSAAAGDTLGHVRMTPEEAREFATALTDFVRERSSRFRDRTPESHPDTESVELQTALFPHLPEVEEWARAAAEERGRG